MISYLLSSLNMIEYIQWQNWLATKQVQSISLENSLQFNKHIVSYLSLGVMTQSGTRFFCLILFWIFEDNYQVPFELC